MFSWVAPRNANAVVCAFFTTLPTFACGGMTNFEQVVDLYDFREFSDEESVEGTFDLAAARRQNNSIRPTLWAAGCWAYSFVDVIGATAFAELSAADLPDSERLPETCDNTDTGPCYAPGARLPGSCVSGACKADCSGSGDCPIDQECVERLCEKRQDAGIDGDARP